VLGAIASKGRYSYCCAMVGGVYWRTTGYKRHAASERLKVRVLARELRPSVYQWDAASVVVEEEEVEAAVEEEVGCAGELSRVRR
jgi:hypothetical protein